MPLLHLLMLLITRSGEKKLILKWRQQGRFGIMLARGLEVCGSNLGRERKIMGHFRSCEA
jgi:hypothetical protein